MDVLPQKEDKVMTLEELRVRSEEIIRDALDGKVPEKLEDTMEEIIKDYESMGASGDDGSEWKAKYEDLREKYVRRFSGREKDAKKEEREKTEELDETEEEEKDGAKEKKDIRIKDILKEKEDEK